MEQQRAEHRATFRAEHLGFPAEPVQQAPRVLIPQSAASARMLGITAPRSSWTLPGNQAPLAQIPRQALGADL